MEKNQLIWRCRRGVRELDVLFGRFLDAEYSELGLAEQQQFANLLEVQDPIIMDWLFGKSAPDDEYAELIAQLRELSGLAE